MHIPVLQHNQMKTLIIQYQMQDPLIKVKLEEAQKIVHQIEQGVIQHSTVRGYRQLCLWKRILEVQDSVYYHQLVNVT